MRRIVAFVLMMLVGGYGVAQAQDQPTETETATKDFLGLKWGFGIGVMGGFGGDTAVEKASISGTAELVRVDEEGDFSPQVFLEMHAFVLNNKAKCWRKYQQKMSAWRDTSQIWHPESTAKNKAKNCPPWESTDQAPTMPDPPLMGVGPFVAVQGSDDKPIDAFTLGAMWGFRKDPKQSTSVNIGVGLSFDPSVQVLGHGIEEGKPLPRGESEVRFKKEGRFGWVLMTSFTF